MRILLTTNKTLSNGKTKWVDGGYYNIYLPLKDLGHEVYFWDTVEPDEPDYQKVVDQFKPDLIFCPAATSRMKGQIVPVRRKRGIITGFLSKSKLAIHVTIR